MLECRNRRSTRGSFISARLRSSRRRIVDATSSAGGVPSAHFVVNLSDGSGRPPNASPITVSASPRPYSGATSNNVMPNSAAATTVATASVPLVLPHTCPSPPPPSVRRLTSPIRPRRCIFMTSALEARRAFFHECLERFLCILVRHHFAVPTRLHCDVIRKAEPLRIEEVALH